MLAGLSAGFLSSPLVLVYRSRECVSAVPGVSGNGAASLLAISRSTAGEGRSESVRRVERHGASELRAGALMGWEDTLRRRGCASATSALLRGGEAKCGPGAVVD